MTINGREAMALARSWQGVYGTQAAARFLRDCGVSIEAALYLLCGK